VKEREDPDARDDRNARRKPADVPQQRPDQGDEEDAQDDEVKELVETEFEEAKAREEALSGPVPL
jgi:hypothetical protein